MSELALVDAHLDGHHVAERSHDSGHGGIAAAFAEAVDGRMHAREAGPDSGHSIGHGKAVIVVGVEIEIQFGIAPEHLPAHLRSAPGIKYAERIGQHEMPYVQTLESVHQFIYVFRGFCDAVRPVLEINVAGKTLGLGVGDNIGYIGDMLLRSLAQLLGQMLERSFGQDIDDLASASTDPVDRCASVHESEHFDAVEVSLGRSPLADAGNGFGLSLRYPGGRDLDAVHLEFFKQELGDGQFLVRIERYAGGLLAVAKGGVKYL